MTVRKYRKKPVVIEAVEYTGSSDSIAEVSDFTGVDMTLKTSSDDSLVIHTLEGDMTASVGVFVIKGVNGEFYPCKPDIFEKTYEVAD